MAKKKKPVQPKLPGEKDPQIKPPDPEEPLNVPAGDPDIIPDDDDFENPPPYEKPPAGEGP